MRSAEFGKALTSKGWRQKQGSDHCKFVYPATLVTTKYSQGPSYDIDVVIRKKIAAQMHLNLDQLKEFCDCSLSQADYERILIDGGFLAQPVLSDLQVELQESRGEILRKLIFDRVPYLENEVEAKKSGFDERQYQEICEATDFACECVSKLPNSLPNVELLKTLEDIIEKLPTSIAVISAAELKGFISV